MRVKNQCAKGGIIIVIYFPESAESGGLSDLPRVTCTIIFDIDPTAFALPVRHIAGVNWTSGITIHIRQYKRSSLLWYAAFSRMISAVFVLQELNTRVQSDTMDVLDEKTNGVPPMEIDEIVSVHDRELHTF